MRRGKTGYSGAQGRRSVRTVDCLVPRRPRRTEREGTGSSSVARASGMRMPARQRQPAAVRNDAGLAQLETRQWKERKKRTRHGAERRLRGRRFSRRGALCRSHRRADERPPVEDACSRRHRQGREEPPGQDALQGTESRRHRRTCSRARRSSPIRDDPVAAPKSPSDFAKTNDKLVILGGAMGKTALDADGVKALATLPSLDELRAKLLGMIKHAGNPDRIRSSMRRQRSSPASSAPMPRRTKRPEAVPR